MHRATVAVLSPGTDVLTTRWLHKCDNRGSFVPHAKISTGNMSRNKLTAAVPSPVPEDAADFDAKTAARVCWHYFKEGQTQEEVARRLGFTRKRINRIIGQALSS